MRTEGSLSWYFCRGISVDNSAPGRSQLYIACLSFGDVEGCEIGVLTSSVREYVGIGKGSTERLTGQAPGRSFIFYYFPSQMPRYLYKQRPGPASCTQSCQYWVTYSAGSVKPPWRQPKLPTTLCMFLKCRRRMLIVNSLC